MLAVVGTWLADDPEGPRDFEGRLRAFVDLTFVIGAISHATLAGLFLSSGMGAIAFAAGAMVVVFAGALVVSRVGHQQVAFHVVTAAVIAHATIDTLALGWRSGFHYQLVLAVLLLILLSGLDLPARVGVSLVAGLTYPALAVWSAMQEPWLVLDPQVLERMRLANTVVFSVFFLVCTATITWMVQGARAAHQRAEVDLQRASRHAAATLNHMADGLFSLDASGRVATLNPAMAMMLSVRRSLSNQDVDGIPEPLLELARQAVRERNVVRLELDLPGRRVGAAVASPLLVGADVPPEGAVVLVRDITVDKQVDRMKTELTSMVSHELRTPMTSVLGFAKIVRSRLEKRILPHVHSDEPRVRKAIGQVRDNLDIITDEAERLTALITDVLDIAKMEAGHVDWLFEPLLPSELVDRAVAACSGLFDTEVELRQEVADDLPVLNGDRDRLHQVLVNLVSNAHKFTDEGSVTICAGRSADGVSFAVEDTGPGIPPDALDTVFHKFQQLGEIDSSKPKGTGLGLAICKQIVEAHGGSIDVDSVLGEGAVFRFELPLEREGPL